MRGFGEFYTTAITPDTPILLYLSLICILAIYTVRQGLGSVSKIESIFLSDDDYHRFDRLSGTIPDKDYRNLLPILEYGFQTSSYGGLTLTSLFSSFVIVGMIFPYINDRNSLKRYSFLTSVILVLLFFGPMTGPIAAYGGERGIGFTFPTFQCYEIFL
ncbi:GerAB/ArcD/ProY family transporter [Anaerobacillus sp. HL2]|nr:GerAB/ArcD/ProY family transporter [Anaerobacillus sp. HL2]